MTIDPGPGAGRQEDRRARNVLWLAGTPARDLRNSHLVDLVIIDRRFGHVAGEEARRDGVHIDLVFGEIRGEVFGEVDDPRFTG